MSKLTRQKIPPNIRRLSAYFRFILVSTTLGRPNSTGATHMPGPPEYFSPRHPASRVPPPLVPARWPPQAAALLVLSQASMRTRMENDLQFRPTANFRSPRDFIA